MDEIDGLLFIKLILFSFLLLIVLLMIRILCGIGLSTLVMGSKANKSSEDLCGFSDNHLLKIGGICCFIHGILCNTYYVLAMVGSSLYVEQVIGQSM